MKAMKHRRGLSAVLAGLFLVGCLPVHGLGAGTGETTTANSVTGTPLVTEQCQVFVSSGEDTAHYAVDGITNETYQWASDPMKTNETTPEDNQTPQWLTVDLGEDFTEAVEIEAVQLWYNMKVWPMVYEIQTSSDNGAQDEWSTLARVERSPFNGAVKNGQGQNIADETGNTDPKTAANRDVITADTTPALVEGAAVERYVRFYVEKVNTLAPGNNVCLREIQIYAKPEQEPEEPTEEPWNLALNRPVDASGAVDNTVASNAVDGSTTTQWNTPNLKDFKITDNSKDDVEQTPQWIQIDLGATGSTLSSVNITYVNNMVWAMEYKVQTTDTPDDESSWEDVAHVSRPSANSTLVNGQGQNIADTSTYTDTITTTSTPALTKTELGRYVRVYFLKTNAQAPGGDNINIREITIMGTNPNIYPPVDVDGEMNKVTVSNPAVDDTQITLPATAAGADLVVRGSELENVVANDGAISQWNIGSRDVTLLLRLTDKSDETSYAQKNVTVTVPDHSANYPDAWFPTVSNPNPKPEVIPTVQEWYGYEGSFTLTADSKVILNDQANVGLDKVAQNLVTDVKEISGITLTVETGTAPTSAHDIYIESLTDPNAYDVGEEGYVMVTNDQGLHIYAPTYTGCLYGTITAEQILWQAEDHVSIPKGIMRDYPAYEVRGLMLDVARTPYRYQQLKDYAKIMLWYKMNEFHLHVNDNDNCNINNATVDTHSGFHRLESEEFPSLTSETKHAGVPEDLINSDYYNNNADYQGNPTYTKEQWRELTQMCEDMGMYVLTELDMPGHSLLYNKYAEENPDEIDWLEGGTMLNGGTSTKGYLELLDLTGENKDRALRFATTLWNEYTEGTDPVVSGDVVHIGADEYWVHNTETNNAFAKFADSLRETIQNNLGADTKIRMWGAGTGSFATAETALGKTAQELAEDYQLDIWHTNYERASERVAEGYQVINCRDAFLYANPGRTNRDVPNAEYLFYDWNPTNFGGYNTLMGEPNLLGAKGVVWGDQSQEGMTEKDIHQRVLRTISILSEKTWGGTEEDDTFTEYELRADRLAEGPGTQIAMDVDSASSLVLDYDFHNVSADGSKVYDASGNGYDATLTGGSVSDGWLTFDGETLLETQLKTLSYPYTVSFDLKLTAQDGTANTTESSLFSGYDGRIQVAGTADGSLSADVNYFTRDFNYQVPTDGTAVNITIVGTFQATRLYVDGQLVTFLSQKQDQDGVGPNAVSTMYSSVLLPLEKIGQDFHGQMANLKVYNKALSAQEVAGTDDGMVNVAQNAYAGGDSYKSSDANGQDNGVQRTRIAMKAVDGETFTSNDDASSEIYSYWQGDHGDSSLTIDLGQVRTISQVDLHWRTDGVGRDIKIMTSLDGTSWTEAKVVSGNTAARQSVTLDAPVEARFVKMQGNQSSGTYKLQEMLVYETVDKTQLNTKLTEAEQAVTERTLTFEHQGTAEEQALFEAVVMARALSQSPLATAEEVEQSVAALTDALDGLPELPAQVDKSELQAAITEAEKLQEEDYTAASWAEFQTALAAAKTVAEDDEASQTQVDNALTALDNAVKALEKAPAPVVVDKSELQAAITEAEKLQKDDYTAASWSAFQTALAAAKTVAEDEGASQTQVDDAVTALKNAVKALEKAPAPVVVDKSELQAAITEAEKLQESDYTAASWSAFQTALAAAKTVAEDEGASQTQVDDALTALDNAVKALEKAPAPVVVDKSELQAAITEAEKLQEEDYTAASWSAFQTALAAARQMLDSETASQTQVDDALTALDNAVKALEKAPEPTPSVEPSVEPTTKPTAEPTAQPTAQPSAEPTPGVSDAPVTDNVPPTGDQNNMTLWVTLLVVCAVVVVAIVVYRAKSNQKR